MPPPMTQRADRPRARRILYVGPSRVRFRELVAAMASTAEAVDLQADDGVHLTLRDTETIWAHETQPSQAVARLRSEYTNLVVLDIRMLPGDDGPESAPAFGGKLLTLMDHPDELEARFGFHRILALVSASTPEVEDGLLVRLGARGVTHALRERSCDEGSNGSPKPFAARVLKRALEILLDRKIGRTALCAGGGGITGIYFEMGALKCLDDCLTGDGVNGFDMFFGISAGAIVSSVLAQGFTIDEMMTAVAGVAGGRLPPLSFRLLRLSHINYGALLRRLGRTAGAVARDLAAMALGSPGASLDGVLIDALEAVGAPFKADRFEEMLRSVFSIPGASNDFRKLPRPLYVGATDQDARRHRLFGADGHDHVPISLAVQASLSINPAFGAVSVEGRYYEDGAVTRTTNFVEAIRRGADLVFAFDPYVPYFARDPGTANERGVLYNLDQDIRSVSYTRFETTRNWAMRKYPHVSGYTFLPSNRLRHLLSANPLDHRPYLDIWKGTYLTTLSRIRHLQHRLGGDLRVHGLSLQLERAEEVARRLDATSRPTLGDFFPDGRVCVRESPLALRRPRMQRPATSPRLRPGA